MAQAVIDSQIKPDYTSPQKCSQGCARWKNLAEDGNTVNQYVAEAQWLDGIIPDSVGNQCAQPLGFEADGPWCWCKNQTDWGYCQAASQPATQELTTTNQNDRDLKASVCKSTPNELNNLNGEIDNCTSTTELKRNINFAANTAKLQQDISGLSATSMDSLMMGDTMFGKFGYNDIAKQVKGRNDELNIKKSKLIKEVESNEAIIARSNTDFSDVKDTIAEPQSKRFVRFIEDYTLAILSISYLFMIIAVIYVYTVTSELKLTGFLKAFVGSTLLSMFLFMMLFFLS